MNKIRATLMAVGIIGILASLGMALYSFLVLRPRIAAITDELGAGSLALARLVGEAGAEDGALTTALAGLPEALSRTKSALLAASTASSSTAATAHESGEGARKLVVPEEEVKRTGAALQGTSRELRRLAHTVGETADATQRLLRETGPVLTETRNRVEATDRAVQAAGLPTLAMLLGLALSGLYLMGGVVALSLALSMETSATRTGAQPRIVTLGVPPSGQSIRSGAR